MREGTRSDRVTGLDINLDAGAGGSETGAQLVEEGARRCSDRRRHGAFDADRCVGPYGQGAGNRKHRSGACVDRLGIVNAKHNVVMHGAAPRTHVVCDDIPSLSLLSPTRLTIG